MNYAFDFHGVLQAHPRIYKPMMIDLMRGGNMVSVLSGPPRHQIEWELAQAGYERGVHYNHLLSVVDYLHYQKRENGATFELWKNPKTNSWWTDPVTWWSSKAKICAEFNIDVMIDDSPEYADYIVDDRPLFILQK